ncbi:hypothetical protein GOP56_16500 [Brevibacillus sp. 7WMA2]|uniref:hypothetical protein n=1 Tax=Brevibacillus TaxID=55080 RepID=UPI0013A788ED|nr:MULTISPECIES: hypothetical protein [Brevibacillus]MCR8965267.1 hypothetical protein [Brevibacillus laterosporus]MCR8996996.1 hypothetical protein [Brevibacillus laterosporus]MCZ0837422.1 hypothetical protein [Brevibacillus halotolerans]QIC07065.1 hypothetical protein GOP56_16500 [Brevibacillus sp. 7WMA2]WPS87973.1 hypothetical protein SMD22_02845 [Brevibacillus halotolerans]
MTSMSLRRIIEEERGSILPTSLFFLICLCLLLSMVLFMQQVDVTQMRMQHTADIIVKGARTAGQWIEVDSETKRERALLIATTEEAKRKKASIIRGAREEADILYRLNKPGLDQIAGDISITHQKGEKASLYTQGIYHLAIELKKKIYMLFEERELLFRRTSQAGIRKIAK